VFENALERVWPEKGSEIAKRYAQIEAFAASNGWSATIRDPGIRVIFKKLRPAPPQK